MLGEWWAGQRTEQALATLEKEEPLLLDGGKDVRGNNPVRLQPDLTPSLILAEFHLG